MRHFITGAVFAAAAAAAMGAQAQVQITEWMYNGNGATGEYIEFTNLGSTAVDFDGWSFDDDSRTAGITSLTALGVVAPGQSVILTEAAAADFRSAWALGAGVKVVGGNGANLGRSDEINLFDNGGNLVDRLRYSDQNLPGTVRTQFRSGNPLSLADLAPDTVTPNWVLAAVGDGYGSYASAGGDVGNPGLFTLAAVPEPASWALMAAGACALLLRGTQRRGER